MSARDDRGPVTDSRLARPYTATGGRTKPTAKLNLLDRVHSTGRVKIAHVEPEPGRVLLLVRREATSVAEVAAQLRLPVMVVKVLVSDLLDCGAVQVLSAQHADVGDTAVLEAILEGLKRLL